jgi:hypothetical protein
VLAQDNELFIIAPKSLPPVPQTHHLLQKFRSGDTRPPPLADPEFTLSTFAPSTTTLHLPSLAGVRVAAVKPQQQGVRCGAAGAKAGMSAVIENLTPPGAPGV